jgi:hypothetical protein
MRKKTVGREKCEEKVEKENCKVRMDENFHLFIPFV